MTQASSDIAMIGLAVMGQNLVLNMNDHSFAVSVFNRTGSVTDTFLAGPAADRDDIRGFKDLKDLVASLKKPRRVMMLVQAGKAVDAVIEQLVPLLEPGDIVIDGGNSHFPDTERRFKDLKAKGLRYIGTGVSGGEEGARHVPSIMPGGDPEAWPHVKKIFQAVAAKVGSAPCCDWVGQGGAGHFVKMVHNGIEYGDMQLICEAYHLLKEAAGMSADELHQVFADWNQGDLDSYLVQITRDILAFKDEHGGPVVEKILDTAGQKGTGKWTVIAACDVGQPLTLIGEAVFARCLSSLKEQRVAASTVLPGPAKPPVVKNRKVFVEDVRKALFASKIVSYAQGYMLLAAAAKEHGWTLNNGGIALMWRGGCIIRSQFLGRIKKAFDKNPGLSNLLLDDYFLKALTKAQRSWRKVVSTAALAGIPVPAFAAALAFYDGFRRAWLPHNLLQAQRDYFGAHTYERTDKPRGQFFHTNWTGAGGAVTSRTYTV